MKPFLRLALPGKGRLSRNALNMQLIQELHK
jgi:hypothetical protein